MLEPQSRTLLLDALKPPPGYQLDYAIGTTFTLDLVALLAAPLSFALLDRIDADGKLTGDPVALLEALRRNADRFAVFCQAGRISVPRPGRLLLSFLERNVFAVSAPQGGVFHPKVWALRFIAEGAPVMYRFICASRNLTFDRSWDVMLALEGELVERKNAFASNHPVADFFGALPGLVGGGVPAGVEKRARQFQDELRRVAFEPPPEFESCEFFPLGIGKYKRFLEGERVDRLLVVSPYVKASALDQATKEVKGKDVHIVSRLEELQAIDPAALEGYGRISVFSDEQAKDETTAEESNAETVDALDAEGEPELSGLHAKLYIADQGRDSTLWVGSANATDAAFRRNVEFMVALRGKKKSAGIERFLAVDAGQAGFASFLKEFTPGTEASSEGAEQRELEKDLDEARLALSLTKWKLVAAPRGISEEWSLLLSAEEGLGPGLPGDLEIRAWPITCRAEAAAKPVSPVGSPVELGPLAFEALTSFIAFELVLARPKAVGRVQFVLNLPVEGFPDDRPKKLLLRMLDSQDAVVRYIQLLLADEGQDLQPAPGRLPGGGEGKGIAQGTYQGDPLLEPLIRALHRDPARLDGIARLVEDLKHAGAGTKRLPEGFEDIWAPIWEARRRLADEKPAS